MSFIPVTCDRSYRRAWGDGPMDLTLCGWTMAQVVRYGMAARDLVKTTAFKERKIFRSELLGEFTPDPTQFDLRLPTVRPDPMPTFLHKTGNLGKTDNFGALPPDTPGQTRKPSPTPITSDMADVVAAISSSVTI